jgi:hypothetical protein
MDVPVDDGRPEGADLRSAVPRLVGHASAGGRRQRGRRLEEAAYRARPPAPPQAAPAAPRAARRPASAAARAGASAARQDAQESGPPLIDDGIAVHYSELARGTPVYDSDEVQVGTVDEVRDLAREHMLDGIVIKTNFGDRRFVDAPEVARTAERGVTLTISAAQVEELPAEQARIVPSPLARLFGRKRS